MERPSVARRAERGVQRQRHRPRRQRRPVRARAKDAGGDALQDDHRTRRRRAVRPVLARRPRRVGADAGAAGGGASHLTLVPIRPRSRCELYSLRTFSPGGHLSPPRVPRFQSRHTSTPFNSTPDAFEINPPRQDGLGERVHPPPISANDFRKVLARARPTVAAGDLEEHERFTREFGEEG
jgi:hypothetical protein